MEWWRGRRIARRCPSMAALVCCAFSLSALMTSITQRASCVSLDHSSPRTTHSQTNQEVATAGRRLLFARLGVSGVAEEWGPGSYPPRCTTKCGGCTPCTPVHMPVPPEASSVIIAEYYPEAWRCKCRGRLYIP